ncbi:MAG: glycoside hydrolase family 97 catalytic domain-containing protein, partial [Niabella sp.]
MLFTTIVYAQSCLTLLSPDKQIAFILSTQEKELTYWIHFAHKTIIEPSVLGITVNKTPIGKNAIIDKTSRYTKKETYAYRGVHSTASNHYNGATISLISNGIPFVIEVRAYNDGIAFRYIIRNKQASVIPDEATSFSLPSSSIIWSQNNIKYYEGRYSKENIDTIKTGQVMGPPITIELPGGAGFAMITEGGLTDFAGFSLKSAGNRLLKVNLSGSTRKTGLIETPWRIIEIGKDLNTLVNCDIIANVSAPYDKTLFPKGYETDWVKPGRSVWTWLANQGPVSLNNLKKFTDLAAQLGFEYNLVDEGWANWKDSLKHQDHWDMMKELVNYSATKGVKIWAWKAYPDRKGIPGLKEPESRLDFFKKAKETGIVGLKIDFFDSEAQEIINFYQSALKDAAKYKLMINFHGANKPTGETKTYPNEMTREGVRGLEFRPPYHPHNTIIPFTRYLAGHADYTPIHFGDRLGEATWAYSIATAIVFTS